MKKVVFLLFGLLTPFAIVVVTLIAHFFLPAVEDIYGERIICWIINPQANLYAFGIPVALAITINMILMTVTIISLRLKGRRSSKLQQKSSHGDGIQDVVLFGKVSACKLFLQNV